MEDHTDFIEFNRSNGAKVRIVFEMYRTEILFHHYEYKHNEKDEWRSMEGDSSGLFTYFSQEENGKSVKQVIEFPTEAEIKTAQEIISQRYYFWSI